MACFARGMSCDMKPKFNFVSIAEKAFTEINNNTLHVIEFDE